MSSAAVLEKSVRSQTCKQKKPTHMNSNNSKNKAKHDRNNRKRSRSFSGGVGKLKNMKPVLPTKFLLGGNINDPLNLKSLQDEEINRAMNAVTPKSSPIPTPPRRKGKIEVIIPSNIHDPLNLIDCADDAEYEQQLISPVKKGKKKRVKKRRSTSEASVTGMAVAAAKLEAKTPEPTADEAKVPEEVKEGETVVRPDLSLVLSPKKDKKSEKRKADEQKETASAKKFKYSMDKIVSPVVPQPGAWLKRRERQRPRKRQEQKKEGEEKMPVFKEKNKEFQYGNYNRYYGYRNPQNEVDPRLKCFSQHKYLFEGKDILDIGCNIGHITLSVARDFGARSVLGIDIDKNLIGIARKNTKYYVKSTENRCDDKNCEFFPISMPILYGPVDIPGIGEDKREQEFPNNVTFKQGNYVLEDDSLLSLEQQQFDVILCLSVTKWIHLNWGDSGIKQTFRRMYQQLRPGGKLILEPQNWASYKKRKNLTETIFNNYNSIDFFPDNFTEYLLSPAVGFAKSETLACPQHGSSKGFRRHLQVYTKPTMCQSDRVTSVTEDDRTCSVSSCRTEDDGNIRNATVEMEDGAGGGDVVDGVWTGEGADRVKVNGEGVEFGDGVGDNT